MTKICKRLYHAAVRLAASLECDPRVETLSYSMMQRGPGIRPGVYTGKLYLTDDLYIVVAKRERDV